MAGVQRRRIEDGVVAHQPLSGNGIAVPVASIIRMKSGAVGSMRHMVPRGSPRSPPLSA